MFVGHGEQEFRFQELNSHLCIKGQRLYSIVRNLFLAIG